MNEYFQRGISIERLKLIGDLKRYISRSSILLVPFIAIEVHSNGPKRFIFNWTIKFFHHILYEMLLCLGRSFCRFQDDWIGYLASLWSHFRTLLDTLHCLQALIIGLEEHKYVKYANFVSNIYGMKKQNLLSYFI